MRTASLLFILLLAAVGVCVAQEAETDAPAIDVALEPQADSAPVTETDVPRPASAPRFVVILPEAIDREWYWILYTDERQGIVQGAVEKALIEAGFDIVDIGAAGAFEGGSIEELTSSSGALQRAAKAGATHVITGRATASKTSSDVAYGVTVIRSSAEITARLIRVSDGKILSVESASALAGGQAQIAAGREALKQAGEKIASAVVRAVTRETSSP